MHEEEFTIMGWFAKKAEEMLEQQASVQDTSSYSPQYSSQSPFSNITDQVPYGMGGMQDKDTSRDLAESLMDNQKQLEVLEAYIQGKTIKEEYDALTGTIKTVTVETGKPLMNKEGVQTYIGYLKNMSSKNTVMSNITRNFWSDLMIEENEVITQDLICNQEKYNLNQDNLLKLVDIAEGFLSLCLSRGIDRGESILLLKGQKVSINRYEDIAANRALMNAKQSIWSAFSGNNNQR